MLATAFVLVFAAVKCREQYPPTSTGYDVDWTTKSPYWMRDTGAPVSPETKGMKCEAVHGELVGRHGSRFPDNEEQEELEAVLEEKGAAIRNPAFQWLRTWRNPFNLDAPHELTEGGKLEWYQHGQRFYRKYRKSPMLGKYSPYYHTVTTSYETRTSRSASAFMLPVFQERKGQLGFFDMEPISMRSMWNGLIDDDEKGDGDLLIRPYKNCRKYIDEVDDNDDHPKNVEEKKFWDRNMTENIVPRVAQKLNLDESIWKLDMDHVELFYKTCQFETVALHIPMSESTCSVFSPEDFELFAFEKDLGEFYESGPGDQLSVDLVCPLMNAMFGGIKDAKAGTTRVKHAFYFGHSATILPSLAFLGLYQPEGEPHPTADMPWEQAKNRTWKTGTLAPMASNIHMVLHKCTAEDGAVEWKTELLHNERQIAWPKCGTEKNAVFCDPDTLWQSYPTARNCNFQELCGTM